MDVKEEGELESTIEKKDKKNNQILNVKANGKEKNNKEEKEETKNEINEEKKEEDSNIKERKKENKTKKEKVEEDKVVTEQKNETPQTKEITTIQQIEDKNTTNNSRKKTVIVLVSILALLIILGLIFSTIFALINMNNTNIIEGVNIEEISVSGLSIEQIKEKFNSSFSSLNQRDINLKYGDFETIINLEQIGVKINIDEAVNNAFSQGREGNIFQNNYQILNRKINPINIEIGIEFDEEKLNNVTDNISYSLPGTVVQGSYAIDENNLVITKGTKGVVVERQVFKENIIELVKNQFKDINIDVLQIPVKEVEPDKIDLKKIHDEIFKEPQNAYITQDPFQLFVHVNGVDFSIEEASQVLEQEQEQYEIPLIITPPEVTIEDLGEEAFPDTLGAYSTNFGSSASSRGINIAIAANTINGIILMPGEVFSYNNIIGDTTPNKGYRLGGSYLNGELVQSYGGGICQVSSTLYNAVLYANLDIVLRYNHSSAVGYVPASRDATVSYGGKDFKFVNSRKYPVMIKAVASNGVLKIEICGIEEEEEYEVVIESKVTGYIPNTTKYINNPSLPAGQQVVKQNGTRGFKSVAYKVLKLNGVEISRTLLSQDTYNPMQKIVEVGGKQEN